MSNNLTMADLLAKNDGKKLNVYRGQEIEGEVVAIQDTEIVVDLGTKSEGVLPRKDLALNQADLKVGDKIQVIVVLLENEYGQVILSTKRPTQNNKTNIDGSRWERFEDALKDGRALKGKGLEVNKGGLIIEVNSTRGFLPSSQVSLSQVANLEEMIGKEIEVTVIEVNSSQNRLIFSQKTNVTESAKENLNKLKLGDKIKGKVAAVLPFGVFISIILNENETVEGLVHISEISWEKVEDPSSLYKIGDQVEAQVVSVDSNTNRVNLSIKMLLDDPFKKIAETLKSNDVVKGQVTKITNSGILVLLESGVEGLIPTIKVEAKIEYQANQKLSVVIDSIDTQRRRITLVPFVTSTKDLIYK